MAAHQSIPETKKLSLAEAINVSEEYARIFEKNKSSRPLNAEDFDDAIDAYDMMKQRLKSLNMPDVKIH